MQVIVVVKQPWIKWALMVGVGIGVLVALNTGFNPKADHAFIVNAVKLGCAFWLLMGLVIYAAKGIRFEVIKTDDVVVGHEFDPEAERIALLKEMQTHASRTSSRPVPR